VNSVHPPGARHPSVHRLELEVVDAPDVLTRIVSACHQRGCRIVSLHYEPAAEACCLVLGVEAEGPQAQRLALRLSNLVHVLAVRVPGLSG
jgi:acetolactate synthase regulatory subunit